MKAQIKRPESTKALASFFFFLLSVGFFCNVFTGAPLPAVHPMRGRDIKRGGFLPVLVIFYSLLLTSSRAPADRQPPNLLPFSFLLLSLHSHSEPAPKNMVTSTNKRNEKYTVCRFSCTYSRASLSNSSKVKQRPASRSICYENRIYAAYFCPPLLPFPLRLLIPKETPIPKFLYCPHKHAR